MIPLISPFLNYPFLFGSSMSMKVCCFPRFERPVSPTRFNDQTGGLELVGVLIMRLGVFTSDGVVPRLIDLLSVEL